MTNEETQAQTEHTAGKCACGCGEEQQAVVTLDELEEWLETDEVKYGRFEKGAILFVLVVLFALYEWVGVSPFWS